MNWRVKFRLFQVATFGIVFATIFLMSFVTGKYIEAIGFFVSFVALRDVFGKTYHSNSFWHCIFISVIVFSVSIAFIPSKNLTICTCIIFALVVDFGAYKYKDYLDVSSIINRPFNVNNCTEAELISRCKEIGLSEENTILAIEFFIKKTKQSEIAKSLCVEEHAISTRKLRLKQKLNKI